VLRVLTEAPGHAAVLAEELSSKVGPHATLFICGADGTVHEAVNGLMAAGDAALRVRAVLPAGTGNDYEPVTCTDATDFTRILDDMAGGASASVPGRRGPRQREILRPMSCRSVSTPNTEVQITPDGFR
jgi:hypothetical protein